jgi:DnaJ-like protein
VSVREWRFTDYYAVLEVSPRATDAEIDTAFRELAKRWHPDRCGGDPVAAERFKHITAAHNVIGDPSTRARYDRERALAAMAAPPPGVGPPRTASAATVTDGAGPAPGAPRRASWQDPDSWGGGQAAWAPAPAPPARARRRRRFHPRLVLAVGIVLLLGGVLLGAWRITVGRAGASFGAAAVHTDGTVVERDGHRAVTFVSAGGAVVTTRPGGAASDDVGSTVKVVYDRLDPRRAVIDHDSVAKEITIWIAAIKLVVGGAVLIVVSRSQRLRRWIAEHTRATRVVRHSPVEA